MGEFVFDHGWADAGASAPGIQLLPEAAGGRAVHAAYRPPISHRAGRSIAPSIDRCARPRSASMYATDNKLSSVHVNFLRARRGQRRSRRARLHRAPRATSTIGATHGFRDLRRLPQRACKHKRRTAVRHERARARRAGRRGRGFWSARRSRTRCSPPMYRHLPVDYREALLGPAISHAGLLRADARATSSATGRFMLRLLGTGAGRAARVNLAEGWRAVRPLLGMLPRISRFLHFNVCYYAGIEHSDPARTFSVTRARRGRRIQMATRLRPGIDAQHPLRLESRSKTRDCGISETRAPRSRAMDRRGQRTQPTKAATTVGPGIQLIVIEAKGLGSWGLDAGAIFVPPFHRANKVTLTPNPFPEEKLGKGDRKEHSGAPPSYPPHPLSGPERENRHKSFGLLLSILKRG